MRPSLFFLWLICFPLLAAGEVSFKNDREGTSYYSSNSDKRAINRALKSLKGDFILKSYQETLKELDSKFLCSFHVNESLLNKLKKQNKKFNELEGAILYLRSQNQFDDVVTRILLTADETSNARVFYPKHYDDLFYPNNKVLEKGLELLSGFEKKLERQCFDEAYKNLHSELLRADRNLNSRNYEAIFLEAYERRVISEETYFALEKARISGLEKNILNLQSYYKKINSLRSQYPLRDSNEQSNFVTEKVTKQKVSRRQRLYENYSDLQIILMANVIKKLRVRLEAPKAEILIYDRNNEVETITLEPMERFRLAIKLLRKEMSLLALNTYFAGRAPDYLDLMTAAYETGLIPAEELEEVAGLQEIWNPKKTFWQKAEIWVRTLSSVATVALPPPYGFLPALAVVVIEMTAGANTNNDDPTVLF